MKSKNIRIQILTDLYYARFIAIWRPEEEEGYEAPDPDPRPEQEQGVPYILITSSMYKGREEVVGPSPVVPSQHPMPAEFMKQQIRHISYMFANEFGIFKPPSKAAAELFLSKMRFGYTINKSIDVVVQPAQGSITLKQLRDSLIGYTDEELEDIKVATIGENPLDAYAKDFGEYIHTPVGDTTKQYISITKLMPVYELQNPYINTSQITQDVIEEIHPPGTEGEDMAVEQTELAEDALANNNVELEMLKAIDAMRDAATTPDPAIEIPTIPTRDEVQNQVIKDLQAQIANNGDANPENNSPPS